MERIFVGVDWGFEHCHVYAKSESERVVFDERVASTKEALDRVVERLVDEAELPEGVVVGIEKATGLVVEHFLLRGVSVRNVNPAKVEWGRRVFSMSGAKDDRRDARVIQRIVATMIEELPELCPSDGDLRRLRQASRQRHSLVKQKTRLSNRVSAALREFYPAMLELGGLDTQWQLEVLRKAPTPAKARRLRKAQIATILRKARARRTAESVKEILSAPPPLVVEGTLEAMEFELPMWVDQLLLVREQISRVERLIEGLLDKLQADGGEQAEVSDVELLLSMPGIGKVTGASLVGEGMLGLLQENLAAARCVAGVAPVTEATGKRQSRGRPKVHMRRACNHHVRDTLHQVVMSAVSHSPEIRAEYRKLRERGKSSGQACRHVADRYLRVLRAMLRDRQPYAVDFLAR